MKESRFLQASSPQELCRKPAFGRPANRSRLSPFDRHHAVETLCGPFPVLTALLYRRIVFFREDFFVRILIVALRVPAKP